MEFIREGLNLPVPFNIIPMPALILYMLKNMVVCCVRRSKKEGESASVNVNDIEMVSPKENGVGRNGRVPGTPSAREKKVHVVPVIKVCSLCFLFIFSVRDLKFLERF